MQMKFVSVVLAVSIALAACGPKAPDENPQTSEDPVPTQPSQTQAAPAATTQNSSSAMSVEDIDRWQRGLEAELKAVQEAAAKLSEAKDDGQKLEALTAATEMSTIDVGATAAGVDRDRYRRIRNTMSNAVSQLSPIEMEMDLSKMPPEMAEQMKQAREGGVAELQKELPADVFAALKARAGELRQQDKLLVAERLKVATSSR
jgi:predicted small lipoprotein YifL